MLVAALAVTALSAITPVQAANGMVACSSVPKYPRGLTGTAIAIPANGLERAFAQCITRGYNYLYGPGSTVSATQIGYCSNYTALNDPAMGGPWETGTSSTSCSFAVWAINVPYNFQECYTDMHYYPGPSTGDPFSTAPNAYYADALGVKDPHACLKQCGQKYGKYAVWSLNVANPCVCAAAFTATPATCAGNENSYSVLRFTGDIPSGLPGYQRRAVAARAAAADTSVCPGKLNACLVSPGGRDFECLDTTSELESCGGCHFGSLDVAPGDGPTGVDCTAIHGIDSRRAECRDGKCVVGGCRRGFALQNGTCQATKAHWMM